METLRPNLWVGALAVGLFFMVIGGLFVYIGNDAKNIITGEIGAMVFNSKRAKLNYLIDDEKNIEEIIELISKKLKLENKKILINKHEDKYNLFNLNYINFFNNKIVNKDFKIMINEKFCNNYYNEFSSIAQNYISVNC